MTTFKNNINHLLDEEGDSVVTPGMWHTRNAQVLDAATKSQFKGQNVRGQSTQVAAQYSDRLRQSTANTNNSLVCRITDVSSWKMAVEDQLNLVDREISDMDAFREVVETCVKNAQGPLEMAQACLDIRLSRRGVDRVQDEVEICLHAELNTAKEVLWVMQAKHNDVVEELRKLRSHKFNLQSDLKGKVGALKIDQTCVSMTEGSSPATISNPNAGDDSVTPNQWENFSRENIDQAENERHVSIAMRKGIEEVIELTSRDIAERKANAEDAFGVRIKEVRNARVQLENEHAACVREVDELQCMLEKLQAEIDSKDAPLALAKERLAQRSYRPDIELVRDGVLFALQAEVKEIEDSIEALRVQFESTDGSLRSVKRAKLKIEEDIALKDNSEALDVQCMNTRASAPTTWATLSIVRGV